MNNLKIAALQLNPTVGDLVGNAIKIYEAYCEAVDSGAQLVVAPECVLTGYPLEDLVLDSYFISQVDVQISQLLKLIAEHHPNGPAIIFGAPTSETPGEVYNSAIFYDPTNGYKQTIHKFELPNYGVFDEKRNFRPSREPGNGLVVYRGYRLGIMICEDAWFATSASELYGRGADIFISINGSPFEVGKRARRFNVVYNRTQENNIPFVYVNLVGGQDELVFDGDSFAVDYNGVQLAPAFKESVHIFDITLDGNRSLLISEILLISSVDWNKPHFKPEDVYRACVLGLRDYMLKQGFTSAVLGYSGGVDSGLVAAMACDAIGPENVHLVRLPSKFSSEHSLTDAALGAKRLGAHLHTINIEPVVEALREAYSFSMGDKLVGVADENIQARSRGNILMAISNQEGHMLLTTGNKSEVSVGYATLYGDMSGGFNPIKDCYKTVVWDLCRWRNNLPQHLVDYYDFLGKSDVDVVPESIICKPPSAELRDNQKDEDSLPPYEILDEILHHLVELNFDVKTTAETLQIDQQLVAKIGAMLDKAEYKRRQAAPGVKVTPQLFGRERRYPIVNAWRK